MHQHLRFLLLGLRATLLQLKLVPLWSQSNNLLLMLKEESSWLLTPLQTVEEPANEVSSRFMGNHELIYLKEKEPAAAS